MAYLYVKSPTGSALSLQVACSSSWTNAVGDDSSKKYWISPTGLFIMTKWCQINNTIDFPFAVWCPAISILGSYHPSDKNFWAEISSNSAGAVNRVKCATNSSDTQILVFLLVVGELYGL